MEKSNKNQKKSFPYLHLPHTDFCLEKCNNKLDKLFLTIPLPHANFCLEKSNENQKKNTFLIFTILILIFTWKNLTKNQGTFGFKGQAPIVHIQTTNRKCAYVNTGYGTPNMFFVDLIDLMWHLSLIISWKQFCRLNKLCFSV